MTRYSFARYEAVYGASGVGIGVGGAGPADDDGRRQKPDRKRPGQLMKEEEVAYTRAIVCRAILPIVVLVIIIGLVVMLFIINSTPALHFGGPPVPPIDYSCSEQCRASLVESVPAGLSLGGAPAAALTADAWTNLARSAAASIEIVTPRLSLSAVGSTSSGNESTAVFNSLADAAKRGVAVNILLDDSASPITADADALKNAASSLLVKKLNFSGLLGGELKATFIVVDGKHFYLGSAELSQSSLTQRKELGVAVYNCSCLAAELSRLSKGYWLLDGGGSNTSMPWPANFTAHFNATMPLNVTLTLNGNVIENSVSAYIAASVPSPYSMQSMSQVSDAILAAMAGANSTIDVAVADYAPVTDDVSMFWPVVDNAIRSAAVQQQARVRLLVSTELSAINCRLLQRYLASLVAFSSHIEARLFVVVPSNASTGSSSAAAGGVVNNNNYLVTDNVAFVGTSDWTATTFTGAFITGLVANETLVGPSGSGLRSHLEATFSRDWSSQYALNLTAVTCQP